MANKSFSNSDLSKTTYCVRFGNTCCLNHPCDETDVDYLLSTFSVLPVDLTQLGVFSSRGSVQKRMGENIDLHHLSCSVPMILASPHPGTRFLSNTWSVIADLLVSSVILSCSF